MRTKKLYKSLRDFDTIYPLVDELSKRNLQTCLRKGIFYASGSAYKEQCNIILYELKKYTFVISFVLAVHYFIFFHIPFFSEHSRNYVTASRLVINTRNHQRSVTWYLWPQGATFVIAARYRLCFRVRQELMFLFLSPPGINHTAPSKKTNPSHCLPRRSCFAFKISLYDEQQFHNTGGVSRS